MLRAVRVPMLLLAGAAVAALVSAASGSPWSLRVATVRMPAAGGSVDLGLRLGLAQSTLLLLVAVVGLVVASYSARNLQGQPRLTRYAGLELTAVLALALTVSASSLPLLALGWTAASQAVAGLVGHAATPAARAASRQVRARLALGDLLLWAGVLVTGLWVGTWDLAGLPAALAAAPGAAVSTAALLAAGAGMVRSALVPAHRWLPETAEAPSPVSALLHAGFVNGVGVLALLLWPLMHSSGLARLALLLVGVGSVLLGAAQIRTRADLKGRLAASTSSQMGYLALQVALGIPAAVLAHIVGHGVWKARKFLGAGGAVQRSRLATRRGGRRAVSAVGLAPAVLLGVAATAGAAVLPLGSWPVLLAPADLLPLTVAAVTVGVAGTAVLRSQVRRPALLAALSLVAVAGAAYVIGLRGLTALLRPELAGQAVWGTGQGQLDALAVAGLLALGVTATGVDASARRGRLPGLVRRVARSSMPLRTARDWLDSRPAVSVGLPPVTDTDADLARQHISVASATTATLYPLTSFVASNPLGGLEGLGFAAAARVAEEVWGASAGPSAESVRRALQHGHVTPADVAAVLDDSDLTRSGPGPEALAGLDLRALVKHLLVDETPMAGRARSAETVLRRAGATPRRVVRTPLEMLDDPRTDARVRELAHQLCARTMAGAAWPGSGGPWTELRAQAGALDALLGVRGAADVVVALSADPAAASAALLEHLGLDPVDRPVLLGRLLARDPGWPGQLSWRARHAALGRAAGLPTAARPDDADRLLAEVVATRLALEVIVAEAHAPARLGRALVGSDLISHSLDEVAALLASPALRRVDLDALPAQTVRALAGRLDALVGGELARLRAEVLDRGYRARLLPRLEAGAGAAGAAPVPRAQVVTCIDVRSERLRRHLEGLGGWETFGAAGFFGLPVAHTGVDGQRSERTPALLRPTAAVTERARPAHGVQGAGTALRAAATAVEANPVLPFGWAEGTGWFLAPGLLAGTLAPARLHGPRGWLRRRVDPPRSGDLDVLADIGLPALADAAAGFLAGTGLAAPSPIVMLLGHGATVTNNPHVAAYDCGACGGAAGDVSARVMAAALNDPRVREALAERGVRVPTQTWFAAAVHDTTTDLVRVLDRDGVPARHRAALDELESALSLAGERVRGERMGLLPDVAGRGGVQGGTPARAAAAGSGGAPARAAAGPGGALLLRAARARAADWAQPRPEWGLAGAAAIVVGPRSLTAGLDLDGRVFLQSYRPDLDGDGTILEQHLTAPVVVAQWITAQYWASVVDPDRFGAGDKTTHNVIGDGEDLSAVLSGARGDLRLGLPWQAVSAHAPERVGHGTAWSSGVTRWPAPTQHSPQRLLVAVCADPDLVEEVLARRPEVAGLVTGEWVTLCALDPASGRATRRLPDGGWVEEGSSPPPAAIKQSLYAGPAQISEQREGLPGL